MSADELPLLQSAVRNGLDQLRRGEWWVLEKPLQFGIARMGRRIIRGHRKGAFRDLFQAAVFDLVQEWWNHVGGCPRCGSLFLKSGKQMYCSPTCGQKARMERFRSKRPPRDYHAERERAARKKLGPNVRVGRRAR